MIYQNIQFVSLFFLTRKYVTCLGKLFHSERMYFVKNRMQNLLEVVTTEFSVLHGYKGTEGSVQYIKFCESVQLVISVLY
jgi:hypothetical protein